MIIKNKKFMTKSEIEDIKCAAAAFISLVITIALLISL